MRLRVEVTDEAGLTAAVDATPVGEALELTIARGRQTGTVTVTVAERRPFNCVQQGTTVSLPRKRHRGST